MSISQRSCNLSQAVRSGRCGTDPAFVPEFIRSRTVESARKPREDQWQVQAEIVSVLFDTIADPLLASCWRNWCCQCCCMPLHSLRCLSSNDAEKHKARKLEIELHSLKAYYLSN